MLYNHRVVVPLATLTVVGLLATDLYLPAVPSLPTALNGSVAQAQATLAAFVAAFALAQLAWGSAWERLGLRRILILGTVLLCGASIIAALAPDFATLIAARALQGVGAAAATVVVPVILKRSFDEHDSLRAIAALGMAECVVPAAGPVIGAALLTFSDWRASFWLVAICAAASLWQSLRVVDKETSEHLPGPSAGVTNGYVHLLRDPAYMRIALSHALAFAALLSFVASIPQVLATWSAHAPRNFALLQISSVTAFILCAHRTATLVHSWGEAKVFALATLMQIGAAIGIAYMALIDSHNALALGFWWTLFGASHGLRGPLGFAKALSLAGSQQARGSALLVFMTLALSAAGIQATALFLHLGLAAVAISFVGLTVVGALLLWPQMRMAVSSGATVGTP